MDALLDPAELEADAIYLGVLTARSVKPLSRLEYPVKPDVLSVLRGLDLTAVPVTRVSQNGVRCTHRVIGRDGAVMRRYLAEFDGTVLRGRTASVVRAEARYFGYPSCCAEAFVREPYAPNGLPRHEQRLLFHHACPACEETLGLVPLYRAAHAEATQLVERLSHTR